MDNSKIPHEQFEAAKKSAIDGDVHALEEFFSVYAHHPQIQNWYNEIYPYPIKEKSLHEDVRSIIVRDNFFDAWAGYEAFKQELNKENSPVFQFEAAADAVVKGDSITLKHLLEQNPDLIHARSMRLHHATLLIYTAANGVEGFRQQTPKNAVAIVEILLHAGAEVDAIGDMYGGSTTLGLVATSIHPFKAGLQNELIDILLEHGANPNFSVAPNYRQGRLIVACLANGRHAAAVYLAKKGAALDLEGSAGIGDLDRVKNYFGDDGSLKNGATIEQANSGFIWACEYGMIDTVRFLLGHGIDIATPTNGMTALHWAIVGGQLDIIKLLLERNAPLEIKNSYGGTALGQALWSAFNEPRPQDPAIIKALIAAGAKIEPGWDKYIDEVRKREA